MGNCCNKEAKIPEKPVRISEPPTGIRRVRNPRLQEKVSSVSANNLKGSNDERGQFPLRELNSSTLHTRKDERNGLPSTSSDWQLLKVNRKDKILHPFNLYKFPYSELKAATKKFSTKNFIGEGGFGDVYQGWIRDYTINAAKPNGGLAIAVKRLRKEGQQGHDEWQNELMLLSRLNHPHIVKLIGYCVEDKHKILVYEYMTKGSLETHLSKENTELNWNRRIKIAIGAAKGLDYLHSQMRPVIHRDLKAPNILLNDDFQAKISDFGLAKYGPQGDKSHISTRVIGTQGYFAPEYITSGHLTLKSDVYSFGVVLLEIFSGSGAIRKYTDGMQGNLAQWAKPYLRNQLALHKVIDKKLGRNYWKEEAQHFSKIILRCISSNPKSRPTMTQVVADLEHLWQNMFSCRQNPHTTTTCHNMKSLRVA